MARLKTRIIALACVLTLACGGCAAERGFGSSFAEPPPTSCGVLLVNHASRLPGDYIAVDLVKLYDHKRSFQLMSSEIYLTYETFAAANRMFEQARYDGVTGFIVTDGYRSADEQRAIFDKTRDGTAAPVGASEHQTGLAFDVTAHNTGGFDTTPQFQWLAEHCWEYGFILRYPKGKERITGIPYEPWHYRYVGDIIAREIHENGWTLEEYCEQNGG